MSGLLKSSALFRLRQAAFLVTFGLVTSGLLTSSLMGCGGSARPVDGGAPSDAGAPDSGPPVDAGSFDAGLSCGADNFAIPCNGGGFCPILSTCVSGNSCQCESDSVALTCGGQPCSLVSGGCNYPDWWCAPRTAGSCGPQNFTVACTDGDGGTFHCPTGASCLPGNACACPFSTEVPVDCSGAECIGGCSYPNWWCAPRAPGACGALNFTVPCPGPDGGEFFCPTNALCEPDACRCPDAFVDLSCQGAACLGNCTSPDWWCAPRDAGACGAQNFTVPCPDGDGGTFFCPTHAVCEVAGCGCGGAHPPVDCSGQPCDGGCAFPNWWCG
jgi:hypothetical protein